MDGAECGPQFWFTNCQNSPFDPLDPTDDIVQNDIVFWANNTSGVVDLNRIHRWRLNTYDFYTGAAYGLETGVHISSEIAIPYTNNTHLASSNYANDTVAWNLEFPNLDRRDGSNVRLPVQHNILFRCNAVNVSN